MDERAREKRPSTIFAMQLNGEFVFRERETGCCVVCAQSTSQKFLGGREIEGQTFDNSHLASQLAHSTVPVSGKME